MGAVSESSCPTQSELGRVQGPELKSSLVYKAGKHYRLLHRNHRGGMFYAVDTATGKRSSLNTTDKTEAAQLLAAKNQAHHQPTLNMEIAKAFLTASDPA